MIYLIYLIATVLALVYFGLFLSLVSSDKGRRILVLALRSLWLHKLRAFLSVLGIIIGTAAVIALMAFGEGSMHDALEDIKRQGATNIIVRSVKPADDSATTSRSFIAAYGLTYEDYERFMTISSVTRRVPMRVFPHEFRYLDRVYPQGRLVGTTAQYPEVNQLDMAAGRFLTADDDHYIRNVAVLGSAVADRLFPFEDPLDQSVLIRSHSYKIIGVVKERMPTGGTGGSQAAEDFNHDIYIPLQTCRARFGERIYLRQSGSRTGEAVELSQVTLTVTEIDKVRPTGDVIREMLEGHHLKKDWAVTVPLDRLEEAERTKARYTGLLALIASISLLVGGIGIMNIMLATVTERTREIGIRRALGAKRQDITLQFLVEAIAQTTVGGLVGVVAGLALVFVIPLLCQLFANYYLPHKVQVESIFLSVVVAISVGVASGMYPSWRAALLDPIEALRHE